MMPILETERLLIKEGIIEDYIKVYKFDFNYLENIKFKRLCEKLDFDLYQQLNTNNFNRNNTVEYKYIMSKERFFKLYQNK